MKHTITITTIEAALIDKALLYYDFDNDIDQAKANELREKLRDSVGKDLRLQEEFFRERLKGN